MAYTPYYPGGWQSGEQGGTPITPAALNNMENGIAAAHDGIAQITGNILGGSKILTSTYTSTAKIPAITTLGFLVHDYGGTVSVYALYGGRCDLIAGTGGIATDGNAGGQTLTFPNSGTNRVMLIYR